MSLNYTNRATGAAKAPLPSLPANLSPLRHANLFTRLSEWFTKLIKVPEIVNVLLQIFTWHLIDKGLATALKSLQWS